MRNPVTESRPSRRPFAVLCLALLLVSPLAPAAAVVAEGLFPGMAVLNVDGERVTLRPGQSRGAVKLISVTRERAVLEIDGERRELTLSGRVDSAFMEPERRTLTVPRNAQMQYVTQAEINGRRVEVLIDTGANTVAMNSQHAEAVGIAPDAGVPASVRTASDIRTARQVQLTSVSVGGIAIQGVTAIVIEGPLPETILLGMSYLQHVELEERNGVMMLQARW